jgi:hypothetical protein
MEQKSPGLTRASLLLDHIPSKAFIKSPKCHVESFGKVISNGAVVFVKGWLS